MVKVINMSKKHTQEFIDNYINKQGWKNLSTYKNNETKLNLICPEGHSVYMIFNVFQRGCRCIECYRDSLKLNVLDVNKYITNEGWINNSKYINKHTKLDLICPNNHKCRISFNNFERGRRCKSCYLNNNKGENSPVWKEDRTRRTRANFLSFDTRNKEILKNIKNFKLLDNNLETYNVDHIYPRMAFIDNDLDKLYENIIVKKICNSLDNLQILTKFDNQSKSCKYNHEEFIKWFNIKIMKESNFVFS